MPTTSSRDVGVSGALSLNGLVGIRTSGRINEGELFLMYTLAPLGKPTCWKYNGGTVPKERICIHICAPTSDDTVPGASAVTSVVVVPLAALLRSYCIRVASVAVLILASKGASSFTNG